MSTVNEIKLDLTKKVASAMEEVKKDVCDIILKVCMEYYGEYTPSQYVRTFQIAQALQNMAKQSVKSRVVGANFEIYVDSSMFNHDRYKWSEERILNSVMLGGGDSHGGAMPGGTAVWTKGEAEVAMRIQDIVKNELISAGIPIS